MNYYYIEIQTDKPMIVNGKYFYNRSYCAIRSNYYDDAWKSAVAYFGANWKRIITDDELPSVSSINELPLWE